MELREVSGADVFEEGVVDPLDGVDETSERPGDGSVDGELGGHGVGGGSVVKMKTAWGLPTP